MLLVGGWFKSGFFKNLAAAMREDEAVGYAFV